MSEIDDYVAGFRAIRARMSETQREILEALLAAPGYRLSASQLKELLALPTHARANLEFGRLGRMLAETTGHFPTRRSNGSYRWWRVLADDERSTDGRFIWILKPVIREALELVGFTASESALFPDSAEVVLHEGSAIVTRVNAYERNPVARRRCIEHYGSSCSVCGINFGLKYGEQAEGAIHVHHLRPLSEIGAQYEVNPVSDLRPVCPNCHMVIHRRDPPFSIAEVRQMLRQQQATASAVQQANGADAPRV